MGCDKIGNKCRYDCIQVVDLPLSPSLWDAYPRGRGSPGRAKCHMIGLDAGDSVDHQAYGVL